MYEELVAWLRSWSELPAHCECYESCGECNKQDICSTFTNERIITKAGEAADAIEELQGWNNTFSDSVAMLMRQIAELSKRVPKTPHGRLIDADELHKLFIKKGKEFKGIGGAMLAAADWCIANAPTVIEAEEGET